MADLIDRQEAINVLCDNCDDVQAVCPHYPCKQYTAIDALPSVQPLLCGYNIDHLMLIASVLQKENLPPERVAEMLMDTARIIEIVRDEFEETLQKAMVNRYE